jgi:phosphatidate cytidylyltransferase
MVLSWAGDTAALSVGRAFGKHKLAPHVSPGKTWEGAAGSVAGAMLVGGLYGHYLIPQASLGEVLVLAMAGNIAGQVGDLCESALKRGAGVKDSGTLLPGHGGWLDRLDSSFFSVPVVYALLLLFTRLAGSV